MSYDEGVFIEPLACVVRGLRMSGLQPGQSVLVLGSGIAGLLNIKLARALGAGRIMATDVSEYRLDAAKRFGADHVFKATDDVPRLVKEVNGGAGVDLVIVCTGAPQGVRPGVQVPRQGQHAPDVRAPGPRSRGGGSHSPTSGRTRSPYSRPTLAAPRTSSRPSS